MCRWCNASKGSDLVEKIYTLYESKWYESVHHRTFKAPLCDCFFAGATKHSSSCVLQGPKLLLFLVGYSTLLVQYRVYGSVLLCALSITHSGGAIGHLRIAGVD